MKQLHSDNSFSQHQSLKIKTRDIIEKLFPFYWLSLSLSVSLVILRQEANSADNRLPSTGGLQGDVAYDVYKTILSRSINGRGTANATSVTPCL